MRMVSFYSWRINQLFMLMKLLGGMTGGAGCLSWRDLLTSEKMSSFFSPFNPYLHALWCLLWQECLAGPRESTRLAPWLNVTLLSLPFSPYEALPLGRAIPFPSLTLMIAAVSYQNSGRHNVRDIIRDICVFSIRNPCQNIP